MDRYSRTPGELLGSVGGNWDVDTKRFIGEAKHARIFEVTELQRETTVYWLAWLAAYLTKDWAPFTLRHGRRPFSLWSVGGRRRGKTWLGVRLLAAFAIACPEAVPAWLISPIEDDFDEGKELHREWTQALPPSWFEWNSRELYIQMVTGARILMFSAHDAEKLKNGACGFAFWNEVQKSRARERGLANVRGGCADTGTIVHVACNPPRNPDEYWIDEMLEGLDRGTIEGKLFDFRGDNPYVNEDALDSMRHEMSERDYLIEREGARLPRPDVVLHDFRDGQAGNVKPRPLTGEITEAFLKKKFGRPFAALVSCDFQRLPHQAACVDLFFADLENPADAISYTIDEIVVEDGDENALIDGLEAHGWHGRDGVVCVDCKDFAPVQPKATDRCPSCDVPRVVAGKWTCRTVLAAVVVGDASGAFQASDRKQARISKLNSFQMFRSRGWPHIYPPDATQARNPEVAERVAAANARLCNGAGRRRAFIEPQCTQTIEALKKWPTNKHGQASRWSPFAHRGDAWTYGKFRLWPRNAAPPAGEKPRIDIVNIHQRDDRAWK